MKVQVLCTQQRYIKAGFSQVVIQILCFKWLQIRIKEPLYSWQGYLKKTAPAAGYFLEKYYNIIMIMDKNSHTLWQKVGIQDTEKFEFSTAKDRTFSHAQQNIL